MPGHTKKEKKKRRSLAGTKAGEELAGARAKRSGKIAVKTPEGFEEKTPEQVEAKKRIDIETAKREIKGKEREGEAAQLSPKTDAEVLKGGGRVILEGAAHDEFGLPLPVLSETVDEAKERQKQEFQNIGQVALLATAGAPKAIAGVPKAIEASKNVINIAGKNVKRFPVTTEEFIERGKQVVILNKAAVSKSGGVNKKGLAIGATILGAIWATNEFVLSPSELATWAAVDNVAGVTGFHVKNIVDGVQFNNLDPDVAQERIDEAKETIAHARSYVNIATMLNPKMWGPRKQMLTAIDAAKLGVEDNERRLNQLKGGN